MYSPIVGVIRVWVAEPVFGGIPPYNAVSG